VPVAGAGPATSLVPDASRAQALQARMLPAPARAHVMLLLLLLLLLLSCCAAAAAELLLLLLLPLPRAGPGRGCPHLRLIYSLRSIWTLS